MYVFDANNRVKKLHENCVCVSLCLCGSVWSQYRWAEIFFGGCWRQFVSPYVLLKEARIYLYVVCIYVDTGLLFIQSSPSSATVSSGPESNRITQRMHAFCLRSFLFCSSPWNVKMWARASAGRIFVIATFSIYPSALIFFSFFLRFFFCSLLLLQNFPMILIWFSRIFDLTQYSPYLWATRTPEADFILTPSVFRCVRMQTPQ